MEFLASLAGGSRRRLPSSAPRVRREAAACDWRGRLARWGALWLYVLVASGLPIPVLIVDAQAAQQSKALSCGMSVCGCSLSAQRLGSCCCAKKNAAGKTAKRSCCAAHDEPTSDESANDETPPQDDAKSPAIGATLVFFVGIEAAKCRGEDIEAGLFLLPHLPTSPAAPIAAGVAAPAFISVSLYPGRSADPPLPPPRWVASL